MMKLYKRSADGALRYHEAWVNDGKVTVHWGVAGERGETKTHLRPDAEENPDAALKEFMQQPVSEGFRPLDEDSWRFLIIEYKLGSEWGERDDLDQRHRLEDRLNESLGWTGVGHCDGGSTGAGTMEVCCVVADFEIARKVIESDLNNTEFSNHSRIYDEAD